MKKLLLLTVLIAASLCAVNAGDLPANYKTVALAYVKSHLRDSDSVKVLRLRGPDGAPETSRVGTLVWVECNAKNGFGGYTGVKSVLLVFKNGAIVNSAE